MLHLGKKRWLYVFVAYLAYLLAFACRTDFSDAFAPTRYTCSTAQLFIYPVWERHFQPHIELVNEKTGLGEKLSPLWERSATAWATFDETHALSYTLDKYKVKSQDWASANVQPYYAIVEDKFDYYWARVLSWYRGNAGPVVEHYFNSYNHWLVNSVDNSVSYVSRHTSSAWAHTVRHTGRFLTLKVVPFFSSSWAAISTNSVVVKVAEATKVSWIAARVRCFFDALFEKGSASFKSKTDFLLNELMVNKKEATQQEGAVRATSEEVIDVVKTILEDVTSFPSTIAEEVVDATTSDEETAIETEEVPAEDDEEEISTSTLLSTVTETVEATVEATVVETETATVEVAEEDEASDSVEESDDEPITQTVWLTATVYDDQASDVPVQDEEAAKEVTAPQADSPEEYEITPKNILDEEIQYWRSKVDNMLKMAYGGLEEDMLPVLNATLDPLKEELAANFTRLQQENYARYKVMNALISSINKDSEYMKDTNEIIEHPEVDRQRMRDEISACKAAINDTMVWAEDNLNAAHAVIVEKYFDIAQQAVDVIESYTETLMSEFSARLTELIRVLESEANYEDKFGWNAWKENHKIKESIFEFRDKIFDDANLYKDDHRKVKPRGLEPWVDYVANINFHINFLKRDTEEYLQLVRAKANVAYQMRETLTRQFTEALEAKKAAEALKAQEAAEAEAIAAAEEAARKAEEEARKAAEEVEAARIASGGVAKEESEEEDIQESISEEEVPEIPSEAVEATPQSDDNGEAASVDVEDDEHDIQSIRELADEEVIEVLKEQLEEAINAASPEVPDLDPDNLEADTRL